MITFDVERYVLKYIKIEFVYSKRFLKMKDVAMSL